MTGLLWTCPDESYRPDRLERISKAGDLPAEELAPGVWFDCLVGLHNAARNLTTGEIKIAPGARLRDYTLPVGESITLLSGVTIIGVEEREYVLDTLDNITIPRNLPHCIRNPSVDEHAILHIATACGSPGRHPVSRVLKTLLMEESSGGIDGKERVTRFKTAPRSEAGSSTSFIDYFNKDLVPGIEMSGGYGFFHRGGRLPAHFHDFDESICILQGVATCVVEGRRYQMTHDATALQPRGRVHYFINEIEEPMAMLWVYGGPVPERIVVDERYATAEHAPWGPT